MAKKTNQDETVLDVEELYSKSEKFVDDNKKQLSLGLGAVAAVILVVIGYSSLIVAPKNHAAEERRSWRNTTSQRTARTSPCWATV